MEKNQIIIYYENQYLRRRGVIDRVQLPLFVNFSPGDFQPPISENVPSTFDNSVQPFQFIGY